MIVNKLRPYQKDAHNAVISHFKKSAASIVIDAVTAAGKSWIIAAVAQTIKKMSGKHILCIAPNSDLVMQNREKYLTTGEPASIFSASLGVKCLRHDVVFATPLSIKSVNDEIFKRFALIVIDEAHGITPTIINIIDRARIQNPLIRVLGLTGTPYRHGTGYIYRQNLKGKLLSEDKTKNPFFDKLIYKITGAELLKKGFITPVIIGEIGDHYENINHLLRSNGKFFIDDLNKTFIGQGRKTAFIVGEIADKSKNRKGVMIFASTVQHAKEIMESLPPEDSMMIGGDINNKKEKRKKLVSDFKAQKYKYLVSVATMTTGVDFTHVDVIALLRPTESAALLTQIIGRGLRLHDDKKDCLLLDYAGNLDSHFPDGDLFSPQIKVKTKKEGGETMDIVCPTCNNINEFKCRENKDGYKIDDEGYFTDLLNKRVETENGEIPAHYGRRCQALISTPINPSGIQCGHRWNSKECPHCKADNDIAARYCTTCKGEIIDPNEKLHLEFKSLKKDPYQVQIDEVLNVTVLDTMSKAGNPCLRVKFVTPYRNFEIWLQKEAKNEKAFRDYNLFINQSTISTVTYNKEANGFFRVLAYNQEVQKDESK